MARKYRQRGYMDDDREERRPRRDGPRPPRPEGPRGRGLGRPTASSFRCARCGGQAAAAVAVEARCGGCGADLHTCTNCRHFDTSARFECRREIPERIAGKATGNECELFEPRLVQGFESEEGPRDAKSAFDALFDF